MTDIKIKPYTGIPERPADLTDWVAGASAGAWACYRVYAGGWLDLEEWQRTIAPIMVEAYSLFEMGLVNLLQRRTPHGIEYLMQRRQRKY